MDDSPAGTFAAELTGLIHDTVGAVASFHVAVAPSGDRVGPNLNVDEGAPRFGLIPLQRTADPDRVRVWLKAEYTTDVDPDGHLRIQRSTFGLWTTPAEKRRPTPVFRLEYDRDKTAKPAAHVHFHAESAELGWLYGTAGIDLPRFDDVHFPLGGRRFRPTLEDVLLFLDSEGLFRDWRPGWRQRVQRGLDTWELRQAKATVRSFPEAAADQLRTDGWTVTQPSA